MECRGLAKQTPTGTGTNAVRNNQALVADKVVKWSVGVSRSRPLPERERMQFVTTKHLPWRRSGGCSRSVRPSRAGPEMDARNSAVRRQSGRYHHALAFTVCEPTSSEPVGCFWSGYTQLMGVPGPKTTHRLFATGPGLLRRRTHPRVRPGDYPHAMSHLAIHTGG